MKSASFTPYLSSQAYPLSQSIKARPITFAADSSNTEKQVPQEAEKPLGFIQSTIQWLIGGLLNLLPKSIFHFAESLLLYVGQGQATHVPSPQAIREEYQEEISSLKESIRKNKLEKELALFNQVQEVTFTFQQGKDEEVCYGWHVPAKAGKPTILYAPGNAESLHSMINFQKLVEAGYGVLGYQYPGYGNSTGKPDEDSLSQSLKRASDLLVKKGVPVENQIVYGISLGGAVAAEAASERPFKAVILQSTMTSFGEVVKNFLGKYVSSWLFPIHACVQSQWKSLEKIGKIKSPLLIMHGSSDDLIPHQMGKRLHDACSSAKKLFVSIADGEHNLDPSVTNRHIQDFFNAHNI